MYVCWREEGKESSNSDIVDGYPKMSFQPSLSKGQESVAKMSGMKREKVSIILRNLLIQVGYAELMCFHWSVKKRLLFSM